MCCLPNIRVCPYFIFHRGAGVAHWIIHRPFLTPVHFVIRHRETFDFGPWILLTSCPDVGCCWGGHFLDTGLVEVTATGTDGSDGLTGYEWMTKRTGDGRPAGREICAVKIQYCRSLLSPPCNNTPLEQLHWQHTYIHNGNDWIKYNCYNIG